MNADLFDRLEVSLGLGLREDARRLGSTEAIARVLLVLEPGVGVPMTEVARRLGRDPTTATRFVDRAVAELLVRREVGRRDRRRRLVVMTPEGEAARDALITRRRERAETVAEEMLTRTGLGAGQVEWFLKALADSLSS